MNNQAILQLNKILNILINKDPDKGISNTAKYWKIDTAIYETFNRLEEKLKNCDLSLPLEIKKQDNRYNFYVGTILVTPCIATKPNVALSTLRQYIEMITSFNLGYKDRNYTNTTDFVNSYGKIKLVSNITQLISQDNRIELVKKVITNSLFSNDEESRCIAYSILIELIFKFNIDLNLIDQQNIILEYKKTPGKLKEKELNNKFVNLIINKQDITSEMSKHNSYKKFIDLISEKYESWEIFINEIYYDYMSLKDGDNRQNYAVQIEKQIIKMNIESQIKNLRSSFKDEIFNDRKRKGLINLKDDLYSDLIDQNGKQEGLLIKFNEAEAAHIFGVAEIKKAIINETNREELLNCIKDPSNGLIMKVEYHRSFDRGQWTFDINGDMLVKEADVNYLFNIKKLKRVKINPKIMNKSMIEYLKTRW